MHDQESSTMNEGNASGIRTVVDASSPFPPIRRITILRPFSWLRLGWRDFRAAPLMSLFYGVCFAAMGWILRFALGHAPQYISSMSTGFLLLGPLLALGLYDMSRRIEMHESAMWPTLYAINGRWNNIGILALVLGIVMLLWARASLVVFALFFNHGMPTMENFIATLFSLENVEFLAVYCCIGFLFASIAFAIGWISIPLMLDRDTDAISAMIVSTVALFINAPATMLWALMIVAGVVFGFLTWNLGFVIAIPVIGHATWHAYREVVGRHEPAVPASATI